RLTMGQRSDLQSLENVRKELNLDKPVMTRYLLFLHDLSPIGIHSKADQEKYHYLPLIKVSTENVLALKYPYLGRSYRTKREVATVLGDALPGTMILALAAMSLATVLGIGLGVIAVLKKDTWMDVGAIAASVAGISMPSFFAGLLIAYVFGYLLQPYTGLSMTGSLWMYDTFQGKQLALKNLILPAIALGIRPLA
ncbi:MAG TPA: ABC transporter permease, partial [Flavipsychrobacter sp.]|nr:ABC transporter permease [Flavipsychrobacter sp.]